MNNFEIYSPKSILECVCIYLIWLSFFLNEDIFGQFFDFICFLLFKYSKQIDLEKIEKKKFNDILNCKNQIKNDFIYFHYVLHHILESEFQFHNPQSLIQNPIKINNTSMEKTKINQNSSSVEIIFEKLKLPENKLLEQNFQFKNLELDGIYDDLFESLKLFCQSRI